MAAIAVRQAALDDSGDILALLLHIAGEIPLDVETLEREEALYALIRNCARSGESWVACDEAGHIVGVVLAEPNQRARHYAENELLELHHAGVMPEWRNRRVFARLVERLLARMLPVVTTIPPLNRSGIAEMLERRGFRAAASAGGERRLRRDPGARA